MLCSQTWCLRSLWSGFGGWIVMLCSQTWLQLQDLLWLLMVLRWVGYWKLQLVIAAIGEFLVASLELRLQTINIFLCDGVRGYYCRKLLLSYIGGVEVVIWVVWWSWLYSMLVNVLRQQGFTIICSNSSNWFANAQDGFSLELELE